MARKAGRRSVLYQCPTPVLDCAYNCEASHRAARSLAENLLGLKQLRRLTCARLDAPDIHPRLFRDTLEALDLSKIRTHEPLARCVPRNAKYDLAIRETDLDLPAVHAHARGFPFAVLALRWPCPRDHLHTFLAWWSRR